MLGHPLDCPAWGALTTRQSAFAEGGALARRFRADIGPLSAACDASAEACAALAALARPDGDAHLLQRDPPAPPAGVAATLGGVCLQMIVDALTADAGRVASLETLGESDAADMQALAALTRPGPWRARTYQLGRFLGVREAGRLVAMAGERMRLDGYVEISAVCTHPDARGRGLGAALLRAVGQRILDEGATPFLHAYAANAPAVALYRRLGFSVRAEVAHVIWRRLP